MNVFSLAALSAVLQGAAGGSTSGPLLPHPVTNNAVAFAVVAGEPTAFSFMGLDSTRAWNGVTGAAFSWRVGSLAWREIPPVPGPGRLAATAQGREGKLYVIGGYTVAEGGSEKSSPSVDVYHPTRRTWTKGAPMPIPSDDAVSGLWRDSLIYVVSGWHDTGNVSAVQIYDPSADRWQAGTPIPGPPVFGHAGAIARNTIVYLDGVRTRSEPPRFLMETSGWRGDIDPTDPSHIEWRRLPPHPGPALYRAAAGSVGPWVVFAGGTDNPYNYDGIGYDGDPSSPLALVFGFNVATGEWRRFGRLAEASMDHRGLLIGDDTMIIVGGIGRGQRVSARVSVTSLTDLLISGR
ncbi:MAG: hypothetical protein BMS9Abin29_1859 [Gemmatimonadota bacterium]|nr:MAG: hypothetical protein BMS9Abin29_1859 [Gemmatimonadota bacterium]